MPFVQRVVEPIYLSRQRVPREDGEPLLTEYELEEVTNNTLSNALRQLASLVLVANDIFDDLAKQLQDVCERSNKLRTRIDAVEEKVSAFDPKTVTVPESDICTFSLRTVHFSASHELTTGLFSAQTRPEAVRCLYEAAAKTPIHVMRQLDRYRRDGHRSSRYFMCTPVLAHKRRRLRTRPDIEIETHTPAAVAELRRWTSSEALGDVTVAPDCTSRIAADDIDETDHRLPSPEEQVQAVAMRFPSEVVSVDISGRTFERMSLLRRSLLVVDADGTVRRRSARRKPRGRRRNTIAGTDRKELRQAVIGESLDENESMDQPAANTTLDDIVVVRSASTDLLRSKDESPPDAKKSHFNSLKQWGKVKLKFIKSVGSGGESGSKSSISPEETNIYEMVSAKGKKADLKHERKSSASGSNIPISTPSGAMSMAVKLRHSEGMVQRRQRQARNGKDDALHSSSGNWSASSESGRASIGSENTSTTHQPKSTTTLSSAATSSNSLHHPAPSSSVCSRRKFLNTSTSSSVSEGTLTPDIIPDLAVPFVDDGETSSIYSCDTEGYYTSFHMDSGLKTLKEEDVLNSAPQTPLHSTTALSNSPGRGNSTLTAENEYELFGKGSTSTTTSSAGTVCTTLMIGNNESNLSLALAPAVPERKSSLDRKSSMERNLNNSQTVVAMVHKHQGGGGGEVSDSPDSGHNTSSSPVDSTSSPHGTLNGRSSEYEFSESDLEGVDRLERIRVKTTINSSRIPSMCVITPPPSDDETSLSHYVPSYRNKSRVPSPNTTNRNNFLETDFGSKNVHNLKLVMPEQSIEKATDNFTTQSSSLEKQASTESDRSSENETVKAVSPSRTVKTSMNGSFKHQVENVETTRDDGTLKYVPYTQTDSSKHKSALHPLNNMLDKVKGVLSSSSNKKSQSSKSGEKISPTPDDKTIVDAGDYVTIADVRNKNSTQPGSPLYSNDVVKSIGKMVLPIRDTEYISLNELPVGHSSSPTNVLVSPSDSLERKRRQGARVTLDSEGKVVYSSDSLRRNKGSHTTFEPGPYVKEPITTPTASPLPSHRVPKTNIRPVTLSKPLSPTAAPKKSVSPSRSKPTSPTSPLLGKVIIRAGSKSNPMTRVASPTSTTTPIIASSSGRPMSPLSTRGAYVNMQSPDDSHRHRCVSPGRTTDEDEEGKPSSHMQPPRYISPPPVQQQSHSAMYNGPSGQRRPTAEYWTLPSRRTQDGVVASLHITQDKTGSGRFNTIASVSNWNPTNKQEYSEYNNRIPPSGYGESNPTIHSAYKSSQNAMMHPSMSNPNVIQKYQRQRDGIPYPQGQKYTTPMPASIPTVPRNNAAYLNHGPREGLRSSTPTKKDGYTHILDMSSALSPIQKTSSQQEVLKSLQKMSPARFGNVAVSQRSRLTQIDGRNQIDPVCKKEGMKLLSPPKSTMTAEQLFAAIHKSKKKLNIKTDSDSYSRSASPSCSSMTSLSPGSSESSINGGRSAAKNGPETGSLGVENVSRNRHSWSPNSNDVDNNRGYLDRGSPCPVTQPGSRQSWACDRQGPIQQTSRNDFKRLLLQHGAKSSPSNGHGTSGGRLSAVEQLKMSRQEKVVSPPSVPAMNGMYMPRSPAEKRTNGSKLLQSPRSVATWRFASPRSDVLSSTILEDCAEEEKASNSPQENSMQPYTKLPSTTESSHGHTLTNAAVRRPLNLSFGDKPKESPRKDTLKQLDVVAILQQYRRDSSPKPRSQLIQNQPVNRILEEKSTVQSISTNKSSMPNNRTLSHELLSPSNIKENVNTNQQPYNNSFSASPGKISTTTSPNTLSTTQLSNLKARQLFMQQSSALSNHHQQVTMQPSSPRIQVSLEKQRTNFYNSHGSPGRSILGTIDTKSPSKSTLETAL